VLFSQHRFSIDLGICLQWPHLHHSRTGSAGGLCGVGGLAGLLEESPSSEGLVSDGPEDSLTVRRCVGDPCMLIIGPESSVSSAGIN